MVGSEEVAIFATVAETFAGSFTWGGREEGREEQ